MKPLIYLVAFLLLGGCGVCNKASQDLQNAKNMAEGYKNIAENLEQNMKDQEKRMVERRASGDTTAMKYQDLQNFLPDLPGYKKEGDPKGQMANMGIMSYSQTTQKYVDGENQATVTIVDYSGAYQLYTMATAFFQSNLYIEDDNSIIKSEDLGVSDVSAWSETSKTRDEAKLMIGAGSRFFITIESKGNKDVVEMGKSIPLGQMGAM